MGNADRAALAVFEKQARWARSVVWAVFLLALGVSCGLRWSLSEDGTGQIVSEVQAIELARGRTRARAGRRSPPSGRPRMYGTTTGAAVDNYQRLIRGLAYQRSVSHTSRKVFERDTRHELVLDFFAIVLVQAIIVLIFPTMFHIRTSQGLGHLRSKTARPAVARRQRGTGG